MVTKKRKSLKTKRKQRGGAGLKVLNLPQPPKKFDNTIRRPSSGDYPLKSGNTLRIPSSGYETFHPNTTKYENTSSLARRNSGISVSSVSSGSSISSDSSGSSVKNMLGIYGHKPPVPPRNLAYDTGSSSSNSSNNNSGPLRISKKLYEKFENSGKRTSNLRTGTSTSTRPRTKTLRKQRSNLTVEPTYSNNANSGRFLVKTVLKSGKELDLQTLINLNKKSLSGLTENDYFNRLQELIKKDKNFINSVRELDNKREKEALAISIQQQKNLQSDLQEQLRIYLDRSRQKVEPATSLPKSQAKPNVYVDLLSSEKKAKRNSGTNRNSGYLSFGEDDV